MINKIESKIPALMKRIYQQGGADRLQAINIINKSLRMINRVSAVGEIQQDTSVYV